MTAYLLITERGHLAETRVGAQVADVFGERCNFLGTSPILTDCHKISAMYELCQGEINYLVAYNTRATGRE